MDPAALDFLKSLLATPTPSGAEDPGMRLAAKYVADVADEVFLDLHGNLHATFNTKLAKFVADTAEKCGIATQCTARPKSNTNDAWPMRLEHGGIATQFISIPIRYMHSPVETMCLADVEATSRLIEECVCALPANPSFAPDPLQHKTL